MTPVSPGEERLLQRDWKLFAALTFLFSYGFATYNGVFQNFLREVVEAKPIDLGLLESLREVPGLLAALTAGSLMMLAQSRVAALGLAITGIGIMATTLTRTLPPLIAASMFWSVGFHLYSTVSGAIILALAKGKEGGRHLGRMAGIGASATIAALGTGWVLSHLIPNLYNVYFGIGGLSILAAAALCGMLSKNAESHTELRFVVRREYGLYYLMIFLEGCRRQIFAIFASYTLIAVYHQPVERMLLLQFVNSILISITAPAMGRVVDRYGERGPLSAYAIGLILVFLGYSYFKVVGVLYALFIIDNVLFTFGVGITTYLNRIVRPNELRPCLAMGTTMNHIAAVTVPLGGAFLWQQTGNYQLPFYAGSAIAVISLAVTRLLPAGPPPKHEDASLGSESSERPGSLQPAEGTGVK
ncbi:MAG TPA: MFS transporter [Fimbriimonas sp.]